jgi:hypothetical protein
MALLLATGRTGIGFALVILMHILTHILTYILTYAASSERSLLSTRPTAGALSAGRPYLDPEADW